MTHEEFFNLKMGDRLERNDGTIVYVAINCHDGLQSIDSLPERWVVMGYKNEMYGSEYVPIKRYELDQWTLLNHE